MSELDNLNVTTQPKVAIKFRPLIKQAPKDAFKVLNTISIKKKKKVKTVIKNSFEIETNTALNTEISKNYEGIADSIAGLINTLPKELQQFINNAALKTVVNRQGYSLFVLDNNFTFKLKDVKFGKKNKLEINIKQGKKHILTSYI